MPNLAEKVAEKVEENIHRIPHVTSMVADVVDEGVEVAKRVGKRASDATEELMDDTVYRVKRHPVESLITVFALGVIVGGLVDWLTRRR